MAIYPPNTTGPKKGLNYLWNFLGSSLKTFATALQPYMSGGSNYKSYVAQISQTGVNPPVSNIMEDTTGLSMTWVYNGIGDYLLQFNTIVPVDKIYIPNSNTWTGSGQPLIAITDNTAITGYISIMTNTISISDCDGIAMKVFDPTFTSIEFDTLMGSSAQMIEIRIYN